MILRHFPDIIFFGRLLFLIYNILEFLMRMAMMLNDLWLFIQRMGAFVLHFNKILVLRYSIVHRASGFMNRWQGFCGLQINEILLSWLVLFLLLEALYFDLCGLIGPGIHDNNNNSGICLCSEVARWILLRYGNRKTRLLITSSITHCRVLL